MGGEGRVKQGWLKSISAGWGGHRLAPLGFGVMDGSARLP